MNELTELVKDEASGLPLEVYSSYTYRKGLIGVESSVIISFVLAGIVGGVTASVGKDIWSAIKRIAIGALRRRTHLAQMELEVITVRDPDEKTTLILSYKAASEDELEDFLAKAHTIIAEFLSKPNFRAPQSDTQLHIQILSNQKRLEQLRKEGGNLMPLQE